MTPVLKFLTTGDRCCSCLSDRKHCISCIYRGNCTPSFFSIFECIIRYFYNRSSRFFCRHNCLVIRTVRIKRNAVSCNDLKAECRTLYIVCDRIGNNLLQSPWAKACCISHLHLFLLILQPEIIFEILVYFCFCLHTPVCFRWFRRRFFRFFCLLP